MQKIIVTMMAFALTVTAQVQAQEDGGLADLKAAMIAAKIHQDSIDTARLVVVYDYECHTQDADGQAVTDRMKLCLLVGQHCTRSFPYRKFRKEREWADGEERAATDFLGLKAREYLGGYDFFSEEELPLLRSESYCMMPEVWTNYPDGKTTVRDAIPPTIYETQEARTPIDWTLTDNTVTISGYLCKTATCQLHGRQWTVRYCEDIPTTAGPWKLCGLPGLIVEAVSDDDIHRFTLTDLQHATAPIYYETSAITSKTSEEKLIKNRNKTFGNRLYPKNPHYYITDLHSADTAYDNEGMLINGVYVNDKMHVYQPLEKE
ncbi:MAG: GLPGLI family protein [Prevotella sp.]|nr:GLPGLI family protein [Prevotella sp.]